ncbi:MAG: plasmid stabilization system protein ParE [Cyclobacteriaceae bacterium]|jgi:plasmid stabilization system protein ParE
MNYEVIIKPDAELDLTEIVLWYESKNEKLGRRFLEAIEVKIQFLELNPNLYQARYKKIRFTPVRLFPYAIHYTNEEQKVYLHAVLSTNRNPRIWKERNP